MDEKKQTKPRTGANIAYLLKLTLELDPLRVLLQFLEQAVRYGIWIFFSVIFLRYLLQSIEANVPVGSIFAWLGLSMAVLGLTAIFFSWYNASYLPLSDLRMSASLSQRLFAQAVRVDLACYEDEEFFNRYTLAIKEAETRLPEFLKQLTGSITAGIAAVVVIITLEQIDPWMLCFLLFPLIGNFVFGPWLNRVVAIG